MEFSSMLKSADSLGLALPIPSDLFADDFLAPFDLLAKPGFEPTAVEGGSALKYLQQAPTPAWAISSDSGLASVKHEGFSTGSETDKSNSRDSDFAAGFLQIAAAQHDLSSSALSEPQSAPTMSAAKKTSGPREKRSRAEKAMAVKEKNKRAQKAFRERQKARLVNSETRVVEYESRLAALEAKNASLHNRNIILEKMLQMRISEPPPTGIVCAANDLVANRANQMATNSCLTSAIASAYAAENTTVTLQIGGQTVQWGRERAASLQWSELVSIWKEYAGELASCLVTASGDPASPNDQRLSKSLHEAGSLMGLVAVGNPTLYRRFLAKQLEQAAFPEAGNVSEMWSRIAASLGLSEAQKAEMVKAHAFYTDTMAALLPQRRELETRLLMGPSSYGSTADLASDYLRAADVVEQLTQNLKEDHLALMQLNASTWKHVLTTVQAANVIVQAFPWAPDLLSLVKAVAVQQGEYREMTTDIFDSLPPL